jgi:uncharacterized protein YecE (DUF72 family)
VTLPLFDPPPIFDRAALGARLRALAQENIWIGTSSWKYEGWLGQMREERRAAYIFVNNRPEGDAPETIRAVTGE